jgi:hypothetical protein
LVAVEADPSPSRTTDPRDLAPASSEHTVAVHSLGAAQTGGWCWECSLPSVVTIALALEIDGVEETVVRYEVCTACGREGRHAA